MPSYDYRCDNCGWEFDVFQSMSDKKLRKCPECQTLNLKRLISSGAAVIVRGTQTPCHGGRRIEEINEIKKEKKKELETRKRKAKELVKKNPPWWRSDPNKIDQDVLKNPKKYIETGEKD